MHDDELEIDVDLVRRLLGAQFPQWAEPPLERVDSFAIDFAIFRLGGELSVRLARRRGPTEPGGKEPEWLPRLAPLLRTPAPASL